MTCSGRLIAIPCKTILRIVSWSEFHSFVLCKFTWKLAAVIVNAANRSSSPLITSCHISNQAVFCSWWGHCYPKGQFILANSLLSLLVYGCSIRWWWKNFRVISHALDFWETEFGFIVLVIPLKYFSSMTLIVEVLFINQGVLYSCRLNSKIESYDATLV